MYRSTTVIKSFFPFCFICVTFLSLYNIFFLTHPKSFQLRTIALNDYNDVKCWEDFEYMRNEKTRMGPGEQGTEVIITDPDELVKLEESVRREGFYVEVSDKFSLTRAIPDHRLPE